VASLAAVLALVTATAAFTPSAAPTQHVSVAARISRHPAASAASAASSADARLLAAMRAFVRQRGSAPGLAVVVQRGRHRTFFRAGLADLARRSPLRPGDSMRVASVAKAFSGAVTLALVSRGVLALTSTVGRWLPSLPAPWHRVTLAQLLQHTSGIADFSRNGAFLDAVRAAPLDPPPPARLLRYARPRLLFRPGTRYHYSNTDNIIAALMAERATHLSYLALLRKLVFRPLHLIRSGLPRGARLTPPVLHGYARDDHGRPEDVTHALAAGWSWSSGGVVSTPADLNAFIRAYVSGRLVSAPVRAAQFSFRPGSSEPPGPGTNSAGLALFRYQTSCGTVYGHTGNTAGYTQFAAATANGHQSVTVTASSQIIPAGSAALFRQLRRIYLLAVCAATGR
jgi:D-alanyl-D-alanine carboxypeptidase